MSETIENKLDELPTVVLPEEGRYKFIVVEITDGRQRKSVLVGSPFADFHSDVLEMYERTLPKSISVQEVHGGGRILVSERELCAFGTSYGFGTAPQALVETVLKQHTNEKGLGLLVQMGRGY